MGLFVAGWIKIPALMKEKRFPSTKKPMGFLGTLFVGVGFAAGWTPCIGPIFASILWLAASHPGHGVFYTLMYVIGFALPFLVLTFFLVSLRLILCHSGIIFTNGFVFLF